MMIMSQLCELMRDCLQIDTIFRCIKSFNVTQNWTKKERCNREISIYFFLSALCFKLNYTLANFFFLWASFKCYKKNPTAIKCREQLAENFCVHFMCQREVYMNENDECCVRVLSHAHSKYHPVFMYTTQCSLHNVSCVYVRSCIQE